MMMHRNGFVNPALAAMAALAFLGLWPARGDGAQRPPEHHTFRKAKVIWRSCTSTSVRLEELARWAAPILWFSPDEPLLEYREAADPLVSEGRVRNSNSVAPLPQALYYDDPDMKGRRVVYAWVRHLLPTPGADRDGLIAKYGVGRGDAPKRLWDDAIDVEDIEGVSIRYLFYYPEDIGAGAHRHDLESVEIELSVQRPRVTDEPIGCRNGSGIEVALVRASGAAHGVGWFTSTLNSENADDILLPLTILVEEGKHASAPDRNGDGHYTPGYDVNVQTHDAWGVRDTMRAEFIDSAGFRPEMNKTRRLEDRVFPPLADADFKDYLERRHEVEDEATYAQIHSRQYLVRRPPHNADLCTGVDTNPKLRTDPALKDEGHPTAHEFYDLLNEQEFCQQAHISRHYPIELERIKNGLASFVMVPDSHAYEHMAQRFAVAWRSEGGRNKGVAFTAPVGHAFAGYWLVAKINLVVDGFKSHNVDTLAVNGLLAPSASRFFDWYAELGAERRGFDSDARWFSAQEAGVRIRFPTLKFPLKFWGARAGVRVNEFDKLTNPRFVLELGGGAW